MDCLESAYKKLKADCPGLVTGTVRFDGLIRWFVIG